MKRESGLPAEACPSFGKPVDSSGLESRYDCKLAVQVVKLVKSLGHLISNRLLVKLNNKFAYLDKVGQGICPRS